MPAFWRNTGFREIRRFAKGARFGETLRSAKAPHPLV
jgi:hypothetical protein